MNLANIYPHPIILESDNECRVLLKESGAVMPHITHGNNQCTIVFTYAGYYWMVTLHEGFPDAEENGHIAIGLPQTVGEEFARNFFRESIEDTTFGTFDSEAFLTTPIPHY